MLNKAVEWELISFNPIAKIKPLKIDKTFHYFTKSEVRQILKALEQPRYAPIETAILILLNTGIRRSELYHLRWMDVDFRNKKLHIKPHDGFSTKSRQTRSIPISADLYKHLKGLKRNGMYVCRPYSN